MRRAQPPVRLPKNPRRILAIKNKHLGDIVLVQPALHALHRQFPDAELDAIVSPRTSELLAAYPWVDMVYEVPKNKKGIARLFAELGLFGRVFSSGYDLVVDFTWSDRAMWYALGSRARDRWAIQVTAGLWFKPWAYTNFGGKPDRSQHLIEHEQTFLQSMGISYEKPIYDFPETSEEETRLTQWLEEREVNRERLVVVHPTSRWLFKCWHDERVAQLIDWLGAQGWHPVLTCGPDGNELDRAKAIQGLLQNPVPVRLGNLSLRELAALIRMSRFFFGMDSAPMHLAAAVHTPSVVLFGPSQVQRWRPYGEIHHVLAGDCPCLKVKGKLCEKTGVMDCLSSISLDQVKQTIEKNFKLP